MNLFTSGECPVCRDEVIVLQAQETERLFFFCQMCGIAWLRAPQPLTLDEADPLETFAPAGAALPAEATVRNWPFTSRCLAIPFDESWRTLLGQVDGIDLSRAPSDGEVRPPDDHVAIDAALRADHWRPQLTALNQLELSRALVIQHQDAVIAGAEAVTTRETSRCQDVRGGAVDRGSHDQVVLRLFAEMLRTLDGPGVLSALLPCVCASALNGLRVATYGNAIVARLIEQYDSAIGPCSPLDVRLGALRGLLFVVRREALTGQLLRDVIDRATDAQSETNWEVRMVAAELEETLRRSER